MAILDIFSAFILLIAVIILIRKYWRRNISMLFIIISFSLLILVALTNVLEVYVNPVWDEYEDPIETLFMPIFIFSVFSFCVQYEHKLNIKKEELLRESHKRLRVALDAAREGFWEWNPEKNLLIIDENLSHLSFTPVSYTIGEENYKSIVHPDSQPSVLKFFDFMNNNQSGDLNVEIAIKTSDNGYKWVFLNGKSESWYLDKSRGYSYGTIIDISKFKEIEHELRLLKSNAEKGEKLKTAFLYNLSHEIRTPINGIIGFSEILVNDPESVQRVEYFNIISSSCQKLVTIVEDIIEISKITVGDLSINESKVSVQELLFNLQTIFESSASAKNISIELKYDSETDVYIFTDGAKLKRILENVVNNAIKFTSEGGVIIGYNIGGEEIKFYVEDTGIGIEHESIDDVFKSFRQIDSSFNRRYGGTGLGLSISKGLAEVLGGNMTIESEPGKGTIVWLSLPYKRKANNSWL